jgi:UDP-N-acetylmuramate--alanine ligase
MKKHYQLHFVGIGGIGMSGIAEIFLSRGMKVTGSDLASGETTERLIRLGAEIFYGHQRANIKDVDVVVISSAVRPDNPEVLEARSRGIPVIPRAEMLAEIMRGKTGIAIAGTHGKTTTTSMTAQILMHAGLDPTVVVGGKVEAIGSNAKVGAGDLVVVEADESDGSFHLLPATHAVITNIDLDHMEYYGTREKLNEAFIQFSKKLPFYGRTWLCLDDAGVREIIPELTKPYSTYGISGAVSEQADLIAKDLQVLSGGRQSFEVWYRESRVNDHHLLGLIVLNVLGRHNVLNALAAIGVAMSAGASFQAAKESLLEFNHVRRRFDQRYFSDHTGIRVVDDYGHHPTEVRAVLATARQTGHPRIVTVFQPHRYTRTRLCWNEFLTCFQDTDELVLLPIYAASEDPIEGVDSHALAAAIEKSLGPSVKVHLAESLEDAAQKVMDGVQDEDLILTLGAGSITKLSERLSGLLNERC